MKTITIPKFYAILACLFAAVLCYMVVDLYFNLSLPQSYLSIAVVCCAGFYGSFAMYLFSKK